MNHHLSRPNFATKRLRIGHAFLIGLSGCSPLNSEVNVHILQSRSNLTQQNNDVSISVRITQDDLRKIASEQLYTHIVIFECERRNERYPFTPTFGSVPATDFSGIQNQLNSISNSSPIELQGRVDRRIVDGFSHPCIEINGGSYLGIHLQSNTVQLVRY